MNFIEKNKADIKGI